jgi:hypothetical protein
MNPKGQWKFCSMEIDWNFNPAYDFAVFRYSGKTHMRGMANGFKFIMSRLPARYSLHDLKNLTVPTIYKSDATYLLQRHLKLYGTKEYRGLRSVGKDACLLSENDKPKITRGISGVLELLAEISTLIKSFESKELAIQWLIQSQQSGRLRNVLISISHFHFELIDEILRIYRRLARL